MGDYSLIKWGMIRDIWAEVIQYGDPDQTGVDLKAHNQTAYRTEAMFSYAVLDPRMRLVNVDIIGTRGLIAAGLLPSPDTRR